MAEIEARGIYKVYAGGNVAVRDLTLQIADAEFMVFVGPSGCGKTTALRMIAGLEDISSGDLLIGGKRVNDLAPKDRDVAMVFQNYALYPHLSVRENIGFGLKLRKVPKAEINRRVEDAASVLGLTAYLDRKPRALSGGQRQRVAMGRAIVREPQAFLMDEPLSNLDAKLRVQMRSEILRLQRDLKVTTVYVTHDQVEAMTMGDRVAVMKKGVLQQVDAPQVLYEHPVNLFVGGFIGSPAMNLVRARLDAVDGDRLSVRFGSHTLTVDPKTLSDRPSLRSHVGSDVIFGIRPEDLGDASLVAGDGAHRRIAARVSLVEQLGAELLAHVEIDAPPVLTDDTRELAAEGGALEKLESGATGNVSTFVARLSPRSAVREGERIELVVDMARAHYFDVQTGNSIQGD